MLSSVNWEESMYHVLGSVARLLMRERQIAHASAATCVASGVAASSARRSLTVRERARAGDVSIAKCFSVAATENSIAKFYSMAKFFSSVDVNRLYDWCLGARLQGVSYCQFLLQWSDERVRFEFKRRPAGRNFLAPPRCCSNQTQQN